MVENYAENMHFFPRQYGTLQHKPLLHLEMIHIYGDIFEKVVPQQPLPFSIPLARFFIFPAKS